MNTNTFDPDTNDTGDSGDTDRDAPLTATGERSTSIDESEDDGVLPVPEPAEGGAPAP